MTGILSLGVSLLLALVDDLAGNEAIINLMLRAIMGRYSRRRHRQLSQGPGDVYSDLLTGRSTSRRTLPVFAYCVPSYRWAINLPLHEASSTSNVCVLTWGDSASYYRYYILICTILRVSRCLSPTWRGIRFRPQPQCTSHDLLFVGGSICSPGFSRGWDFPRMTHERLKRSLSGTVAQPHISGSARQ